MPMRCDDAYNLTQLGRNHLRSLDLSFISGLNALTLWTVQQSAPMLSRLVLHASSHIDDDALRQVGEFEHLTLLDISHCPTVSKTALINLVSNPPPQLAAVVIGPQCVEGALHDKNVLGDILAQCVVAKLRLCAKVDHMFLNWMNEQCVVAAAARTTAAAVAFDKGEQREGDNGWFVGGDVRNVGSGSGSTSVSRAMIQAVATTIEVAHLLVSDAKPATGGQSGAGGGHAASSTAAVAGRMSSGGVAGSSYHDRHGTQVGGHNYLPGQQHDTHGHHHQQHHRDRHHH